MFGMGTGGPSPLKTPTIFGANQIYTIIPSIFVFVRLRCIYVFFEVNVKNEDWAIPNRIEHFSYVGCMKEDL